MAINSTASNTMISELLAPVSPAPAIDVADQVILFNDLVDSTLHLVRLGDRAYTEVLDSLDTERRVLVSRFDGRLVNLAGDGALITFDSVDGAIEFATAYNAVCEELGFQSRTGIHRGDVMVRSEGDLAGLAVHVAARIESAAPAGGVLVSRAAADVSHAAFSPHGWTELKGIPGATELFAVTSPIAAAA